MVIYKGVYNRLLQTSFCIRVYPHIADFRVYETVSSVENYENEDDSTILLCFSILGTERGSRVRITIVTEMSHLSQVF